MQVAHSVHADLYSQSSLGVYCDSYDHLSYSASAGNFDILPSTFNFDVSSRGNPLDGGEYPATFTIQASTNSASRYFAGEFQPANSAYALGTLRCVGIELRDDNDELLDGTITSDMGATRQTTVPAAGPYTDLPLTNSAPGSLGTTVQLIDGTASTSTQVVFTLSAPPVQPGLKPVSDLVELSGTNNDPVVIQISYDPATAQAQFGSFLALELAWFQQSTGTWKNAVLGNTGANTPTYFPRAYNPATDFHLGYFGLDTANGVVWAVVNHNGQFVVTVPPPVLAVNSFTKLSPTVVHLTCTGEPARANRIEASTNLQTWTTLTAPVADGSGSFQFDDNAATGPRKFYRVAYP
jgi:hypothetical protein